MVLGCAHATRASTGGWQRFTLHALHRNLSLLALVFLAVHIASAILDGYVPLQWVDAVVPFVSDYHPLWLGLGAIAFDLMIAVLVTSLLRPGCRSGCGATVHVASYAMWPIAMIHGLGIPRLGQQPDLGDRAERGVRRRRGRVRHPPPARAPPRHEGPTRGGRGPMTALDDALSHRPCSNPRSPASTP